MLLFVDNLTNVDFSYLDPNRGLLGETWLANIELEGELDEQGMICDFGVVKKKVRNWLDTYIDHCLLIPCDSPQVKFQAKQAQHLVSCQTPKGEVICHSPESAITPILGSEITKSSVADWCISQLMPQFPKTVKSLTLTFKEEPILSPYYHYSHGLKKHQGNCQRIAHGHRSKIEIWKDGVMSEKDMASWANRWCDIYIGTQDDVVTSSTRANTSFAYKAEQGSFYLSLPSEQCYLIDSDSTVEHIAQHIANRLAIENPGHKFKVKAYEGIAKGAIAEAEH